jgi:glycerol kinase
MAEAILAIDAGTTGRTTLLVDQAGEILARGYQEVPQYYPQPGWVEQDATEIWKAVVQATQQALANSPDSQPIALGIANQRETIVVWDRSTGAPLHRAIVWQCHRSEPICQELIAQGWESTVRKKTGLRLDPYFSGTKALWLMRSAPTLAGRVAAGDVCFGTVDTWLAWQCRVLDRPDQREPHALLRHRWAGLGR